MSRYRSSLLAAVATAVAALAVACNGTVSPSPSTGSAAPTTSPSTTGTPTAQPTATTVPSQDVAAIYAAINAQVQAIRGLDELSPVEAHFVSPDELAEVLRDQIEKEAPADLLGAYERLYKAMGLMPADQSLVEVYGDLLESQVAGLYVPSEKRLYVQSEEGDVGPLERFFYSHEYEHALQDQHFDLQALQPEDLADDSDRQLARQALIEGDAYVLMTYWLQGNLSPAEILQVLAASQDQEALDALKDIPPIVSNQVLFPATQGLVWVLGVQTSGGWAAVDAAFGDPPDSTEQILHPDKWQSREQPLAVDLPDDLAAGLGDGWSVTLRDTLGEHQIGVWLTGEVPTGGLPAPPPAAAAGWGGDRLQFLEGPDGAWAVVVKTAWDTADDAAEFHDAIAQQSSGWPSGSIVTPRGSAEVWVLITSDDQVATDLELALGLTGV